MKLDAPTASTLPPRDAHKRGLHWIMRLGEEYGTRNQTIKHLQSVKRKMVLTETMPFATTGAVAAEEAGIDTAGWDRRIVLLSQRYLHCHSHRCRRLELQK